MLNVISPGDTYETNKCGKVTVVAYVNSLNVTVKFDDGYEVTITASQLRAGFIKNPNVLSVYNEGIIGVGDYSARSSKLKETREFSMWKRFLSYTRYGNPKYTIDERWLNYQHFAADIHNMMGFGNKDWELCRICFDTDNKHYSKETCGFLPKKLGKTFKNVVKQSNNPMFGLSKVLRVSTKEGEIEQKRVAFAVRVNNRHVGVFECQEKARVAFFEAKRKATLKVLNSYKDQIEPSVFCTLLRCVDSLCPKEIKHAQKN